MKIYKKKKEIREIEHLDKIVCDWCGKEFEDRKQFHSDDKELYSQNRCEIDIAFGNNFPELDGDCRDHFQTELCFSCQLKLLSKLNQMGINFYKNYEQDYWTKKEIIKFIEDYGIWHKIK